MQEESMKTLIIGDIHGCSLPFMQLMEKMEPDPKEDRLILLGDLFDRGPDSWGVMQMVQSLKEEYGERFILLKGNHEDYLLAEKLSFGQKLMWERVGRKATVSSFKIHGEKMEDTIPWLRENCRMYYKDDRIQCVHAGLKVDPIEVNDAYTMLHDHQIVPENHYAGPLTVTGHIALDQPTWYAGDGETTEALPYGEETPLPEHGIICIDTGCGKGGKLTGMCITGQRFELLCAPEA